jgi:hypothetical protein
VTLPLVDPVPWFWSLIGASILLLVAAARAGSRVRVNVFGIGSLTALCLAAVWSALWSWGLRDPDGEVPTQGWVAIRRFLEGVWIAGVVVALQVIALVACWRRRLRVVV